MGGTGDSPRPEDHADSTDAWASVGNGPSMERDIIPIPDSLRPGGTTSGTPQAANPDLPPSLRVKSADITPRSSSESVRAPQPEANAAAMADKLRNPMGSPSPAHSTNPFRRTHEPAPGLTAPDMSEYSEESHANPWTMETSTVPVAIPQNDMEEDSDIWKNLPPSPQKKPATLAKLPIKVNAPMDQEIPPPSNDDWHRHAAQLGAVPIPNYMQGANRSVGTSERDAHSPLGSENQASQAPEVDVRPTEQEASSLQQFHPYGQEELKTPPYYGSPGPSVPPQQLIENNVSSVETPGPSLPPRQLIETSQSPPPKPPRPTNPDLPANSDIEHPSGMTHGKLKETNETYQIRLINWFDDSSPTNPRRSPVMVQNVNGPCPLLALVNALVLSTPSDLSTPLVETLRVREQVSLELLLTAVIDELMSGRRGDAAQNLPDVGDLYTFLVNLHTGMNVNPRFVQVEETVNLMDAQIDVPSTAHDFRRPGGFENTREMKLYSTFAIPLIHGWIPPPTHPAFPSFKRIAQTYEDAQNIMFREEELESKLTTQGLSQEEQVILEDISSIKYFLETARTQLTGYGLDTVTESLAPGSLAILFRNDHFSTLYRHPRSGQLMTLVTDMGYAGHDEVVWQSLVDVHGKGSEFYSGDFRLVGNTPQDSRQTSNDNHFGDGDGWESVPSRARRRPRNDASESGSRLPRIDTLNLTSDQAPLSANVEQEDHDLALAMQLQEEEEDRERREAAARRREDELSQAYLNNADASGRRTFPGFGRGATGGGGPNVPPRGGSATYQAPPGRPPVRRKVSSSEDAPPPSYEQAAKGPAYHPPTDHPSYAPSPRGGGSASTRPPPHQRPRGTSAYGEQSAAYNGSPATSGGGDVVPPLHRGRPSRGRGMGMAGSSMMDNPGMSSGRRTNGFAPVASGGSADDERKEKDCVLM